MDRKTVHRVAKLARVKLEEAEAEALVQELGQIFSWIEQLREVPTEGVAALTSVVERRLPLREDRVSEGGMAEAVLSNAPSAVGGYFVVPKVVE